MRSDAIQDEGDMALQELLSKTPTRELDPGLRERARRLAARHFGAGGQGPEGLLPEGAVLGHYRVERVLGMGGQAVVYLARHLRLKSRLVALKVPHGTETYRMLREGDVMARLDHPGVVKIVDLDAEHEPPYLVLDYCTGGSLADRIEAEGPLGEGEVLDITRQLLEALRFAHLREVVHRDLKPENVLFDASGRIRIADFGLGKVVAEQISLSLSQASRTGVAGTPLYMAPEQERPGAPVDARSDLFALGKLIYHMLTGEPPRTLRPVEHVRGDLELPWSDLVFGLTETHPDSRPADADAVLATLEAWRPQASVAEAPGPVAAPVAAQPEQASPADDWNSRLQRLFDTVTSDLGYALAFLMALGGVLALLAGSEEGVIALMLSAGVGLATRSKRSEEELAKRGPSPKELRELRREETQAHLRLIQARNARGRSPGALFAGVLAYLAGTLAFFTTMGGVITLYLSRRSPRMSEAGEIAIIVAVFLAVATVLLFALNRVLQRGADARLQAEQSQAFPAGPAPAFPTPAAPYYGPAATSPTVIEATPIPERPSGEDPLPRA